MVMLKIFVIEHNGLDILPVQYLLFHGLNTWARRSSGVYRSLIGDDSDMEGKRVMIIFLNA